VKVALGLDSHPERNSRSIKPYKRCDELLDSNSLMIRWKFWRAKTPVIKVEEPYSHQELIDHLMTAFPDAKAITTVRNIESIVASLMSLHRAWGQASSPQTILKKWAAHYHFLEDLLECYPNRLFPIDIDHPEDFRAAEFCKFPEVKLTPKFRQYAAQFEPVNTLKIQARRHKLNLPDEVMTEYSRQSLLDVFPELEKYEAAYGSLLSQNKYIAR
jgi:hypothetical protein